MIRIIFFLLNVYCVCAQFIINDNHMSLEAKFVSDIPEATNGFVISRKAAVIQFRDNSKENTFGLSGTGMVCSDHKVLLPPPNPTKAPTRKSCDSDIECDEEESCMEHVCIIPYCENTKECVMRLGPGNLAYCSTNNVCIHQEKHHCKTIPECIHHSIEFERNAHSVSLINQTIMGKHAFIFAGELIERTEQKSTLKTQSYVIGQEVITIPPNLIPHQETLINTRYKNHSNHVKVSYRNNRRLLSSDDGFLTIQINYVLHSYNFKDIAKLPSFSNEEYIEELRETLDVDDISIDVDEPVIQIEIAIIEDTIKDQKILMKKVKLLHNTVHRVSVKLAAGLNIDKDHLEYADVDLCNDRNCNYQGVCNKRSGLCDCNLGWKGINCEEKCECLNGGKCVDAICQCRFPWYGDKCEKKACENC